MKKIFSIIILMVILFSSVHASPQLLDTLWGNTLSCYSKKSYTNHTSYVGLKYEKIQQSQNFLKLLTILQNIDRNNLDPTEDKSVLINAFNIFMVHYILETKSYHDKKSEFKPQLEHIYGKIGNHSYSLMDILTELKNTNDTRVFFALSNGSISSPNIVNSNINNIDEHLSQVTNAFFKNKSKGMRKSKNHNGFIISKWPQIMGLTHQDIEKYLLPLNKGVKVVEMMDYKNIINMIN